VCHVCVTNSLNLNSLNHQRHGLTVVHLVQASCHVMHQPTIREPRPHPCMLKHSIVICCVCSPERALHTAVLRVHTRARFAHCGVACAHPNALSTLRCCVCSLERALHTAVLRVLTRTRLAHCGVACAHPNALCTLRCDFQAPTLAPISSCSQATTSGTYAFTGGFDAYCLVRSGEP
jgi:hypothetical protein